MSIIDEFIQFVKEEYNIEIKTEPSDIPDTFEKSFGISFINAENGEMQMKCDFDDCKNGQHPFEVITSFDNCWHESKVVRWCPECGAIVVDLDYDGRTKPGYYKKLQYPNIVDKYGLEE